MSQTTKPDALGAAFYGSAGDFSIRFPFVTVMLCYSQAGSLCLPINDFSVADDERGGLLAEISVWLNTTDSHGHDQRPASFPFSQHGFPLGFATPQQAASIIHWASELLEAPAPPSVM